MRERGLPLELVARRARGGEVGPRFDGAGDERGLRRGLARRPVDRRHGDRLVGLGADGRGEPGDRFHDLGVGGGRLRARLHGVEAREVEVEARGIAVRDARRGGAGEALGLRGGVECEHAPALGGDEPGEGTSDLAVEQPCAVGERLLGVQEVGARRRDAEPALPADLQLLPEAHVRVDVRLAHGKAMARRARIDDGVRGEDARLHEPPARRRDVGGRGGDVGVRVVGARERGLEAQRGRGERVGHVRERDTHDDHRHPDHVRGASGASGNVTSTVVPVPGALASSISPRWRSAISRQSARPRPAPPRDW